MRVLLPAPFSPQSPKTSPSARVMLISDSTWFPKKSFLIFRISSSGAFVFAISVTHLIN